MLPRLWWIAGHYAPHLTLIAAALAAAALVVLAPGWGS